jgi:Na+-transporting NADH:ubiquinone oxidoreductase subunit NqrD
MSQFLRSAFKDPVFLISLAICSAATVLSNVQTDWYMTIFWIILSVLSGSITFMIGLSHLPRKMSGEHEKNGKA